VISVGPNTYGHPAPEIRSTLVEAGAQVRMTMDEGDVIIELSQP
jgi:beta-lactamase superfamily II metal-dependent hydrolase